MDLEKFDDLTRAIGRGTSRRSVLKGLLGLGGTGIAVAAIGHSSPAEAARRSPTSIPLPSCPGVQVWDGAVCGCPTGTSQCGPDCCPDGQATCCDNACCYGTCHGEELCCERIGEIEQIVCAVGSSAECCGVEATDCCSLDGCCAGACYGGGDDRSYCCTGFVCQHDGGPVCYGNDACCIDDDCPDDPATCSIGRCNDGTCQQESGGCAEGEVCCDGACCAEGRCCVNGAGNEVCLSYGACCTVDDCIEVGLGDGVCSTCRDTICVVVSTGQPCVLEDRDYAGRCINGFCQDPRA